MLPTILSKMERSTQLIIPFPKHQIAKVVNPEGKESFLNCQSRLFAISLRSLFRHVMRNFNLIASRMKCHSNKQVGNQISMLEIPNFHNNLVMNPFLFRQTNIFTFVHLRCSTLNSKALDREGFFQATSKVRYMYVRGHCQTNELLQSFHYFIQQLLTFRSRHL